VVMRRTYTAVIPWRKKRKKKERKRRKERKRHLGGEADGALDLELLVLGTVDKVDADCEKGSASDLRFTQHTAYPSQCS